MTVQNKTLIKIGKGTLVEFSKDYMDIQMAEGSKCVSSQLYPMGLSGINSTSEFTEVYEYVIYFVEDSTYKEVQRLNKITQEKEKKKITLVM